MYNLEVSEDVLKTFKRLLKKDRAQLEAVNKKIEQILLDPLQFKPLKHPLEGYRRVHVGAFVIIYEVTENPSTVTIVRYKHHDEAYL